MKVNFEQVTTMPLNSTWPLYQNGSFPLVYRHLNTMLCCIFLKSGTPRKMYCLGTVGSSLCAILVKKSVTVLLTKEPFLGYAMGFLSFLFLLSL
jgi:hypothetical protein